MLIPIGHENSAVRRLPWVTWSICLLCIGSFLLTDLEAAQQPNPRDLYAEEATDYFREHAYLEPEEWIVEDVRYDVPPNQRSQYIPALRELTGLNAPETPEGLAEEQAELDRLSDLASGRARPEGIVETTNPFLEWGLVPEKLSATTFVTHMFLHAGWLHLLGNLFMLFIIGPAIEDRWGRPLYAGFYLLAGIVAGATWAVTTADPSVPMVGASGAISGVMGAFMVLYWASQMRFAYFLMFGFRIIRGTFEAPAWLMLGLHFSKELFNAWFWDAAGMGTSIAYWAHVGGFAGGAAVAYCIRVARIEERFVHDKIEAQITVTEGNPAVEAALQAREDGDVDGAFALLEAEVARQPGDPDSTIAFWDVACAACRPAAAAPAMAALVRATASSGDLGLAAQHWIELTNHVPDQLVEPAALLRLAPELRAQGDADRALQALRHAVDPSNPGLSPGLAMRVLDETRESDPPTAMRAARIALGNPELHEARRAQLEAWLAEQTAAGFEEAETVAQETAAREAGPPGLRSGEAIELDFQETDDAPDLLAHRHATEAEMSAAPGRAAAVVPLALDTSGERVLGDEIPRPEPGRSAQPPPVPEPELGVAAAARIVEDDAPELGAISDEDLDALVDLPRFAELKVVEAQPTRLAEDGLYLETPSTNKAKIQFAKMEAVAVAAVGGLAAKPVLVIDLLLNWSEIGGEEPLQTVRLRSDRFDARTLVPAADSAIDALRGLVDTLLAHSDAVALPGREAACGRPYQSYADLAAYEAEVLQIDR